MVGDSVYLAVEILLQAIFPLNLLGDPTINLNDKEFFIGNICMPRSLYCTGVDALVT